MSYDTDDFAECQWCEGTVYLGMNEHIIVGPGGAVYHESCFENACDVGDETPDDLNDADARGEAHST